MRILDLLECEDRINHGLNSSGGQQRHNFTCEGSRSCDLFLERSSAQHGANDVETFAQYLIEIDISFTAGDATDEDNPSFQRHRFEARGEVWTSIQIEHDVKSMAVSRVLGK